ncbi:MAG: peptide ABC transporter substrate-binding protein [Clostridiales bacterium]|nr:peptide ABC transporter substrate-binding protein [Clostridiales bacterium]
MIKRILSLILCLVFAIPLFAACNNDKSNGNDDEIDKGAYIKMYLTDLVYDLDPMFSLNNKSQQKIVSLLFSGLFRLDENGKVKKDLVKSYKVSFDDNAKEYKMIIELEQTYWSDGTPVDAADVIYAWKRILDVENSNPAAPLLFDIKNARAVVEGYMSIDDLGVTDPDHLVLEITFEKKIDVDRFILNLTSPALVPLREDVVGRNEDDWAKKPATIACSGPFTLRTADYTAGKEIMVLERNPYYFRDKNKDPLDISVTPYRLIIDFSLSDEELRDKFDNGEIFYIGEIPLSLREYYADSAKVADEMSTHVYYLNQKAEINGEYLFANENVRRALSLAIDRDTIAKSVVFAKAATALVPYGVFDSMSPKKLFRDAGGAILATAPNIAEAKSLLSSAGVDPSMYSFSISVRAEDEVHVMIAEMVQTAWQELGFDVSLNKIRAIVNDDFNPLINEVPQDIMDDLYNEALYHGDFEVIALDLVAPLPDAFSILAPFAKAFAGQAIATITSGENPIMPHITGFDDEEYNALIEQIFAEDDYAKRTSLLHEAEAKLLEKMPVIPIIFNQDAYVISRELSRYSSSYYQNRLFAKLKLRNYQKYIETTE